MVTAQKDTLGKIGVIGVRLAGRNRSLQENEREKAAFVQEQAEKLIFVR